MSRKLTIVGAGWAGLSAAVRATQLGFQVHLIEASASPGGRAKTISHHDLQFDNGQHALIGAYSATLALIGSIGLNADELFERQALKWSYPSGAPFSLPTDPYPLKLARSLLFNKRFDGRDKLSVLKPALFWFEHVLMRTLFSAQTTPKDVSVAQLFQGVSQRIIQDLISPLCLSAMNTPMAHASANTFLQVLRDAFADPPHSCDFLWPKRTLSEIMPERAVQWLNEHGALVQMGRRIDALNQIDPESSCLLAVPPWQAAKLTQDKNPAWSNLAHQLQHRAIASVYLKGQAHSSLITYPHLSEAHSTLGRLICFNHPMELEDCVHPQFGVQLQAPTQHKKHAGTLAETHMNAHKHPSTPISLSAPNPPEFSTPESTQYWALIVSVADPFKREVIIQNALALARSELGLKNPELQFCSVEKRATFSCEPNLRRPPCRVAEGLWACGDYVQGPYPSTIEGAVRSGVNAVEALSSELLSPS